MKIGSAVGALQTYMDIKGTDMKIRVTDKTSPLHSVYRAGRGRGGCSTFS